jgi:hypothetical protein
LSGGLIHFHFIEQKNRHPFLFSALILKSAANGLADVFPLKGETADGGGIARKRTSP